MVIKQTEIGNRGDKMLCCLRSGFLIAMILLAMPSFGGTKLMSQDILTQSKIKKSSIKKVLDDIKKTLPKELKKCQIVVTDIKLLKREKESVAENWIIETCQDTKEYFVSTYHPKGYFCTVTPKEKVIFFEKAFWNAAKKDGTEEQDRGKFFYIDEIEAMSQDSNSSNTESKSQ